jgi:hypothetical protein
MSAPHSYFFGLVLLVASAAALFYYTLWLIVLVSKVQTMRFFFITKIIVCSLSLGKKVRFWTNYSCLMNMASPFLLRSLQLCVLV